jgi:bifunctional non-homologous end joining protein LigD
MKRDRTTPTAHAKAADSIRVFYMVFDLLYVNGDWLNAYPLSDRIERLQQWLPLADPIHLVPTYDNGDALFASVKEKHMEGIVSKKRNSRYGIGGKNGNWRKIKVTEDLIAVVGAVTYRDGRVNALLIGQYNSEHRLVYIGRVGSGSLTSQDWQAVTRLAELLKSPANPFERQPKDVKKVSWLVPQLTVKIEFQEWTENGSLRQPRILAFVDENPDQCILEEGSDEGGNFP